ncbi:MAG: aconitase X, partial [Nitrososphaerales archaeon]
MDLTREEEDHLDGKHGEASSIAYNILWSVGQLTEAERLIDISSAHVSGVAFNTIGEAGLKFLSKISESGRFSVPTTVNPTGMDLDKWRTLGIAPAYAKKQQTIVDAYTRLGAIPSFTCLPYEGLNLPKKGSHVSWAETSAAIYANSILGLKTNRESALTALASAISGKVPFSDIHKSDAPKPSIVISVNPELSGTLDYGLLGYFAGKTAKEGPIAFEGIRSLKNDEAKSLSAGIGTS